MSLHCLFFGYVCTKVHYTKLCYLNSQLQWSTWRRNVSILYIVIIVFYLKVEFIINGNTPVLMTNKELYEGPVGDYCIARNTIKIMLVIYILWRNSRPTNTLILLQGHRSMQKYGNQLIDKYMKVSEQMYTSCFK